MCTHYGLFGRPRVRSSLPSSPIPSIEIWFIHEAFDKRETGRAVRYDSRGDEQSVDIEALRLRGTPGGASDDNVRVPGEQ